MVVEQEPCVRGEISENAMRRSFENASRSLLVEKSPPGEICLGHGLYSGLYFSNFVKRNVRMGILVLYSASLRRYSVSYYSSNICTKESGRGPTNY
jgi:hypothetical protein